MDEKLYLAGREFSVRSAPEFGTRAGEGESHGVDGEASWEDAQIWVSETDDSTLAHEIGHLLARARGVYLSEYQIQVFEELFTVTRDPRNAWLQEYLFGE